MGKKIKVFRQRATGMARDLLGPSSSRVLLPPGLPPSCDGRAKAFADGMADDASEAGRRLNALNDVGQRSILELPGAADRAEAPKPAPKPGPAPRPGPGPSPFPSFSDGPSKGRSEALALPPRPGPAAAPIPRPAVSPIPSFSDGPSKGRTGAVAVPPRPVVIRREVPESDRPLGLTATSPESGRLLAALQRPDYSAPRMLEQISRLTTPSTSTTGGGVDNWGTRNLGEEFRDVVPPGLTLGKHTLEVARAHERYFDFEADTGLTREAYRLALWLHDAGKAAGRRWQKRSRYQHEYTCRLIDHLVETKQIPMDARTAERVKILVGNDLLGAYLRPDSKQVGLDVTLPLIVRDAKKAGMTPSGWLRALTRYYQSDTLAYTSEGSGHHAFNRLFQSSRSHGPRAFEFDADHGRVRFSPPVEARYLELEKAVEELERLPASERMGGGEYVGEKPREFPPLEELTLVKGLRGGAQLREDAHGRKWVASPESAGTKGHVAEQVAADALYRAVGIGAQSASFREGGKLWKLSPALEHSDSVKHRVSGDAVLSAKAAWYFAAHALLGHSDIYGHSGDVRVLDGERRSLVVTDSSGALRRTRDGATKTFGAVPLELWEMRRAPNLFGGVTWADTMMQCSALLTRSDALLSAAKVDPNLQRTVASRLDHVRFLVDATSALEANGIKPKQIERELLSVMEGVAAGRERPSVESLVKQVEPEAATLPSNSSRRLTLTDIKIGSMYYLEDAEITFRAKRGKLPSLTYSVETNIPSLKGKPTMVHLATTANDEASKRTREAKQRLRYLMSDSDFQASYGDLLPKDVAFPVEGLIFHEALPGVSLEELPPELQPEAAARFSELLAAAESIPKMKQRGFGCRRLTDDATFDPQTGKVLGWNGFLHA